MSDTDHRVVSPAALNALKEALTNIYWFKRELRSFLINSLQDSSVLGRLNWDSYKRDIVTNLVDFMSRDQAAYQPQLIRLMCETANMEDFSHLSRLDDGDAKALVAKKAVEALRKYTLVHQRIMNEEKEKGARLSRERREMEQRKGVREALEKLQIEMHSLAGSADSQKRGYRLEKILRSLFEIFDLDPKASFKIQGEQIDGAFTFESVDFLLEAKWENRLANAADLDSLKGKLSRKLDNTLGLFVSVNGFSSDAVRIHSAGRSTIILMDGNDLMAVIDGRIDLCELLHRKKQHAAREGEIYLSVNDIL